MACETGIYGVAHLEGIIYIASDKSNQILAYQDEEPFTELENEDIVIHGLESPRDLATSAVSRCLFVCDLANRCVWQVQRTNAAKDVSKRIAVDGEPTKLSISSSNQLLVLIRSPPMTKSVSTLKNGKSSPSATNGESRLAKSSNWCLYIDSLDGRKPVKRIQLSSSIQEPHHALHLPNGKFIISHQSSAMDDELRHIFQISEISKYGEIIRTLAPPVVQSIALNSPVHMTFNKSNGNIYVADLCTGRIVLVGAGLTSARILMSRNDDERLEEPHRLCNMEDGERIIVACFSSFLVVHGCFVEWNFDPRRNKSI